MSLEYSVLDWGTLQAISLEKNSPLLQWLETCPSPKMQQVYA